jgi:hypothetical protein
MRGRSVQAPRTVTVELADAPADLGHRAIPIGADVEREDAHVLAAGFDPRTLAEEHIHLRVIPHENQAWREAEELEGRFVMRGGAWLE